MKVRACNVCGHLRVREVYELLPLSCSWRSAVKMASSEGSGEKQAQPVLVIVLCGKRKSGKDYVAERLQEM